MYSGPTLHLPCTLIAASSCWFHGSEPNVGYYIKLRAKSRGIATYYNNIDVPAFIYRLFLQYGMKTFTKLDICMHEVQPAVTVSIVL